MPRLPTEVSVGGSHVGRPGGPQETPWEACLPPSPPCHGGWGVPPTPKNCPPLHLGCTQQKIRCETMAVMLKARRIEARWTRMLISLGTVGTHSWPHNHQLHGGRLTVQMILTPPGVRHFNPSPKRMPNGTVRGVAVAQNHSRCPPAPLAASQLLHPQAPDLWVAEWGSAGRSERISSRRVRHFKGWPQTATGRWSSGSHNGWQHQGRGGGWGCCQEAAMG